MALCVLTFSSAAAVSTLTIVDAIVLRPLPFGVLLRSRRPLLRPYLDTLVGEVRGWMLLSLISVCLVLFLACINVGSTFLASSLARSREIATRACLGATPWRLALAELARGCLFAAAASVAALLMSQWIVALAVALLPGGLARSDAIAIDSRIIVLSLALGTIMGLLIGALPSWRAFSVARGELATRVTGARASQTWWAAPWVISQAAVASAVLFVSILFVGQFSRVVSVDLGLDLNRVIEINLLEYREPRAPIVQSLSEIQGVDVISGLAGASPPLIMAARGGRQPLTTVRASEHEGAIIRAEFYRVSPRYFEAMGISLRSGRYFSPADAGTRVAIVDEAAALALEAGGDTLGTRVVLGPDLPSLTIVGVVSSVRTAGPEGPSGSQIYVPTADMESIDYLLVRTRGPAIRSLPMVRAAVTDLTNIEDAVRPLQGSFDSLIMDRRNHAAVMGLFGVIVLLVSAMGVYASFATALMRQRHEAAVRLALGATPSTLAIALCVRSLAYVTTGACIGLLSGWWLRQLFGSLLVGIARDAQVLSAGLVGGLVVLVGCVATVPLALRVARANPATNLGCHESAP